MSSAAILRFSIRAELSKQEWETVSWYQAMWNIRPLRSKTPKFWTSSLPGAKTTQHLNVCVQRVRPAVLQPK